MLVPMYIVFLWLGKILQSASRLAGNSGAALPGLVIEKLYPSFLSKGLCLLPEGIVIVSGTNGKTTTTKMIADAYATLEKPVLTNGAGSNMTRGLIATLVSHSSFGGKIKEDLAILEVDEAYAAKLASRVPIRGVVLLNVMRDQLDRFGEIDKTARYLETVAGVAEQFVVINNSDPRLRVFTYSAKGVGVSLSTKLKGLLVSDDEWHTRTKKKTDSIDHDDYVLVESEKNSLSFTAAGKKYQLNSHSSGVHNHLNLMLACGALAELLPNRSLEDITAALAVVRPAFGRGETVQIGNATLELFLIKNPSSFNQTIKVASSEVSGTCVVINDAYADSRDVSWLWDIDLSELVKRKNIFVAGTRRFDMALRLKYEDIETNMIFETHQALISHLESSNGVFQVFCTYTAMLDIRKLLVKAGYAEQVL